MIKFISKSIFILFFVSLFSLCMCSGGGGGEKTDTPSSGGNMVTGTAAVGAPVTGMVYVKGTNGNTASGKIAENGTFSIDVSGLTAPYILYVEGFANGEKVNLYSTTGATGNVNVTPATNVILSMALGDDPAIVYPLNDIKNNGVETADSPDAAALNEAKEKLTVVLSGVFEELNVSANFDPMNSEFTADGTGFDRVLILINIEVSEDNDGDVAVVIAEASSGDVYYEEDVENQIINVDNSENLDDAVVNTKTAMDSIKETFNSWASIIISIDADGDHDNDGTFNADDPEYKTYITSQMSPLYSVNFLQEGRDKDEEISHMIEDMIEEELPDNFSCEIKDISFVPLRSYAFTGGNKTFSGNSFLPDGTYTFSSHSFSAPSEDVKACLLTIKFNYGEQSYTEKELWYFVNEGGNWVIYGDQSLMDTEMRFQIDRYIDYPDQNIIRTVMEMNLEDEDNVALNTYGIDSILIIGDGIEAEYAPGQKGILLMRSTTDPDDDEYYKINVNTSLNPHNEFDEESGLNASAIKSSQYRIIGLNYNGTDTFTPVRTWLVYAEGNAPLSVKNGEIDTNDVPNIITPSLEIDALGLPVLNGSNNWTINYSFSIPSAVNFFYDYVYYSIWYNGYSDRLENDIESEGAAGNSFPLILEASDVSPLTDPALLSKISTQFCYIDEFGRNYRVIHNMY